MDLLMAIFILKLYAASSAFATVAYVALGCASNRTRIIRVLVRITKFDQFMARLERFRSGGRASIARTYGQVARVAAILTAPISDDLSA